MHLTTLFWIRSSSLIEMIRFGRFYVAPRGGGTHTPIFHLFDWWYHYRLQCFGVFFQLMVIWCMPWKQLLLNKCSQLINWSLFMFVWSIFMIAFVKQFHYMRNGLSTFIQHFRIWSNIVSVLQRVRKRKFKKFLLEC